MKPESAPRRRGLANSRAKESNSHRLSSTLIGVFRMKRRVRGGWPRSGCCSRWGWRAAGGREWTKECPADKKPGVPLDPNMVNMTEGRSMRQGSKRKPRCEAGGNGGTSRKERVRVCFRCDPMSAGLLAVGGRPVDPQSFCSIAESSGGGARCVKHSVGAGSVRCVHAT